MDKLAIVVPCYNEEEVLKIASAQLKGLTRCNVRVCECPQYNSYLWKLGSNAYLGGNDRICRGR